MNTVAAFASTGAPGTIPGAQDLPTQPFMTTEEVRGLPPAATAARSESRGIVRAQENEALCQELTGLSVCEASISVGKYLNRYWHSILEVDSLLRAALLPIKDCTPKRLEQCMRVLVRRYPDPRGIHRWVNRLMRKLVPLLDWRVVLAYARYADPAIAEQALSPCSLPGS